MERRTRWVVIAVMLGACSGKQVPSAAPSWLGNEAVWFPPGVKDLRESADSLLESRIYSVRAGKITGIDSIWIWRTPHFGQLVQSQVYIGGWQRTIWISIDSLFQPGAGGERWRLGQRECVRQWQRKEGQIEGIMYTRWYSESQGSSRSLSFSLPEKIFIDLNSPVASEWGIVLSVPLTEPTSQLRMRGCPGWDSGEVSNGIFPSLLRIAPGLHEDRDSLVLTRWRLADASSSVPDTLVWQRKGFLSRMVSLMDWGILGIWQWDLVKRTK